MLYLTVHGQNRGETETTLGIGNAGQRAGNLLLGDTRAAHAHRRCMHFIAYSTSLLNFSHLTGRFHCTLVDDSLDEFQAGLGALVARMDTCEVHELNHGVVAIGRKEMQLAALLASLLHENGQLRHRRALPRPTLLGHVSYAVNSTEPHNVIE